MSAALATKSGSVLSTPRFAARQVDLLGTQEPPDILLVDIGQLAGQQRRRPVGITRGRGLIQQRKNALPVLRPIFRLGATITGLTQTAMRSRA